MAITKQQVITALAGLRENRPRRAADDMIRRLLQRYGNGAVSIGELSPTYYEPVFNAAGGSISFEDFYGVDEPPRGLQPRPSASFIRTRSPMVVDLEARLMAARTKTKRSVPGGRVNTGNASRIEDQADDVSRDWPRGEKMA